MCSNSNIEQLGICTFKLRHKENFVKWRFFVVLGNGPALLEMSDIEVVGILEIAYEGLDRQQACRKFYSEIT